MPTRNVVLTDHHEKLIETLIRSGRYQNASEVLREGVRLVEQREKEDAARLEALRDAARVGREALERGDARAFASFEEMERHLIEATEAEIAEETRQDASAGS